MKRRTFMKTVGAATLAGAVPMPDVLAQAEEGAMPRSEVQPNILFIMPDQMRGDALSIERHPVLLTPNMDSIGGGGVRFARAYTTCASCVPARRALLTGRYPANNGMVGFQPGVPIEVPTLPQLLHDAGYATVLVGRHMHQSPYENGYGYERQILGSTYIADDDYARMLDEALPQLGGIRGLGISFNGWQALSWPYDDYLHPTSWTTKQARDVIREHQTDRPLFLTASYYAPHPPLIPPEFYMERYLRMELPPAQIGSWAEPPENDGLGLGVDSHRCLLRGEALRAAQAAYYALINHIDDQVYWLMHEFRELSGRQKRPWMIVLTSDHGEMLGDHYLFRKCEPYEGSARVPLMIQGSAELGFKSGHVCQRPVCLEDLMPTFLRVAGVPVPDGIDGQDLTPVLRGEDVEVRPWLHGEHAPAYSAEQAYHFLTDGRMKYIWRPLDGREQLFDLAEDPGELRDLASETPAPDALRIWRERLVQHLKDRPEGFSDGTRLIPGRPHVNLMPGYRVTAST